MSERYQKYKDQYKKYASENQDKRRTASKNWGNRNKDKVRANNDNFFFGGNKEITLQRDNYSCVKCGMNNEQHIVIFGRGLTVDHIDGKGRYSEIQNHSLDNLQTLCLRCHGSKDGKRNKE